MTVHFIGAGPGAADLITLRGRELIARCPVVLYAGSLVPQAVIAFARADARVLDTAPLTLDEIVADTGRGLLVTELIGMGVNPVTGDFSRGASGLGR